MATTRRTSRGMVPSQGSTPAPKTPDKAVEDSSEEDDDIKDLKKRLAIAERKKKDKKKKSKDTVAAKEAAAEREWRRSSASGTSPPLIELSDASPETGKRKPRSDEEYESGKDGGRLSDEDSIPATATARARKKKSPKKRKRSTNEDSGNDGNDDKDGDSQKQGEGNRAKKTKTTTPGPQVVVGETRDVRTTIGAPRARQTKAVQEQSTGSSPATEATPSSPTPTASRPTALLDSQGNPVTPYQRKVNPKALNKPRGDDFSPPSRNLTNDLRTDFVVAMMTKNAFMTEEEAIAAVDGLLKARVEKAEPGSKLERRGIRYDSVEEARQDYRNAVKNVASGFRGHCVEAAEGLVKPRFIDPLLRKFKKADERKEQVAKLTTKGAFHFEDPEKREGFLANEIVPELFAAIFLKQKSGGKNRQPLAFGPHLATFKPVPNHLLAFLVTAIECALRHWSTGAFVDELFHASVYDKIYDDHLSSIEKIEFQAPDYMRELKEDIWASACESAGVQASIVVWEDDDTGYIDDDAVATLTRRKKRTSD